MDRATDEYSKQEYLALTPTMISLKQKYFFDIHYEKKLTKNIRPTDILQIFSKYSQNY